MLVSLISPLFGVCMGGGGGTDSTEEWKARKIRWDRGLWNVRVSTVLGTFEAHSMTNYIISRLRRFLETKMGRKIKGLWQMGPLLCARVCTQFGFACRADGWTPLKEEPLVKGWGGEGTALLPAHTSAGRRRCRVGMQIRLPERPIRRQVREFGSPPHPNRAREHVCSVLGPLSRKVTLGGRP